MAFKHLAQYKSIIWDWNGTILDDLHLAHSLLNKQLKMINRNEVCIDTYRAQMCFPIKNFYERVGFDFEVHDFHELSETWVREYEARVDQEAKLFNGRQELLALLKEQGTKNYVLSAAPHDHLQETLKRYDLLDVFEDFSGAGDRYASGKLDRAHSLVEKHDIDSGNTALVGDTDHDLAVGRSIGVDVWLVRGGHQCTKRLEGEHDLFLP